MKKLLILIVFISSIAYSQSDSSAKYVFYRYNYGVKQIRAWADSVQRIPLLWAVDAQDGSIGIQNDTLGWKSSGIWRTFYKNYRYSVYDSLGYVGLLNDLSAPGYLKYYGTNLSGTKGWFALPAEKDSLANIRIDSIVTNWNTSVNNSNIGSGYRWLKPSQEIRTAIAGFGVDIDSTTNDSSLVFKLDTVVLKTFIDTVKITGAVTYVGATASGALNFTGAPITSNGTLVLGWTGDSTQVVRGDGSLSTPTIYVDSIYRVAGIDSIYWTKNGNTYKIKDSIDGNNYLTGGSYSAGTLTLNRSGLSDVTISGFPTTDKFVNAATFTGTTLTLTRNDGGTVTTTINTGTSYTFNNGITDSAGTHNVGLGGTLWKSTIIEMNGNTTTWQGSKVGNFGVVVNNSGSGGGGVEGISTNGPGLQGYASSNGYGVVAISQTGIPIQAQLQVGSTNGVDRTLILQKSTGTAANGIGQSIEFQTEIAGNTVTGVNTIESVVTDVTAVSYSSKLNFTGYTGAALKTTLTSYGNGDLELPVTSSGYIMKSPDGTRYKVTMNNGGTQTITAL
jgi:hypothetical protein